MNDVVIAIDVGTIGTTFAFAFTASGKIIDGNLGGEDMQRKDLSALHFSSDHKTLLSFGAQAKEDFYEQDDDQAEVQTSFIERFKPALDANRRQLQIRDQRGNYCDLMHVFASTLSHVKHEALQTINKALPSPILPARVLWVLTVPAIWDGFAKQVKDSRINYCISPIN